LVFYCNNFNKFLDFYSTNEEFALKIQMRTVQKSHKSASVHSSSFYEWPTVVIVHVIGALNGSIKFSQIAATPRIHVRVKMQSESLNFRELSIMQVALQFWCDITTLPKNANNKGRWRCTSRQRRIISLKLCVIIRGRALIISFSNAYTARARCTHSVNVVRTCTRLSFALEQCVQYASCTSARAEKFNSLHFCLASLD
jgi:hypothetical protein